MLNKLAGFLKVDQFIENIAGYMETRIELAKLDLKKEFAGVLAKLIVFSIAIIGILGLFLALTLAIGFLLNELLSSGFLGFFIVALVYGIVTVVGFSAAKNEKWIASLRDQIEKKVFEADLNEQKNGSKNTNSNDDGGA